MILVLLLTVADSPVVHMAAVNFLVARLHSKNRHGTHRTQSVTKKMRKTSQTESHNVYVRGSTEIQQQRQIARGKLWPYRTVLYRIPARCKRPTICHTPDGFPGNIRPQQATRAIATSRYCWCCVVLCAICSRKRCVTPVQQLRSSSTGCINFAAATST